MEIEENYTLSGGAKNELGEFFSSTPKFTKPTEDQMKSINFRG